MTFASKKKYSGRMVFIDQARGLAIALMLVGHSLDRFLGEPWRSGEAYGNYQFVRGISSALFLTVSGFSFVIASFGHFDDYLRFSPRLWSRIRRIALILFLGYVLHLWAPTLSRCLADVTTYHLERFTRYDVLQVIAAGLAALHIIARLAGGKEYFWKLTLAMLIIVLAAAAMTYQKEIDARLPLGIATAVNMYHGSRFPAVPYLAFMLLGALFGCAFLSRRDRGDEWKVFAAAAGLSVALFAFEYVIRNWVPGGIFPYSTPLKQMPGNIFARTACALLTISALYLVGRFRVVLPRLSYIVSKDALAIFFVHLLLVYGGSSYPTLFKSKAEDMNPLQVAAWIIGLSISMTAMAWTIGKLRTSRPILLTAMRHTLILGGAIAFLVWPELSVLRIMLSLAISAAIVAFINRRHLRPPRELSRSRPDLANS
ncbi:MAG: DUF1624 domain-containing protein [Deltaproteobacteria bacterium]|nr:DUF1624 domain-containing protein [Deltaproteobacteria bacterium]